MDEIERDWETSNTWKCELCGHSRDPGTILYCTASDKPIEEVQDECGNGPCLSCRSCVSANKCRSCNHITLE